MSNKISLIIPTHNRVESLKQTIDSIFRQKHLKEIIFVDDSSQESSKSFLKTISQKNKLVKLIFLDEKVGLPTARNIALKEATGDYILFGDDDVIFEDNYSSRLLDCLLETKADIISGRIIYLNEKESNEEALKRANEEKRPILDEKLLTLRAWRRTFDNEEVLFTHACILAKKEVFSQIRFDDSIRGNAYREDTDFQIQAAKKGFKIYYCPHTQLYHLPRSKIKGGCGFAEINPLLFVYFRMRNNYSFLKKHYGFIKGRTAHKYSFSQMLFFAFIENMRFLGSKLLKSIKGLKS